ncbi:hypothetical protein B9Z55_012553 [Caenorhabditis nigoni]|uniref:ELM2 domain-containing protein n=2 Tax=Caenorhabditis nigoni TaxID=1611254 RepID=A0A2G5TXT0_9PELO|nr:hypothetical protein B9Z55_012553 [Caenorhabditis nigoni]
MSLAAPVKKSRRLQEKFNIFEMDVSENPGEHKRYQPRGTTIPLEFGHEPFKFENKLNQKAVREQAKLKLTVKIEKSFQKTDNSVKIGPDNQADLDSWTPKFSEESQVPLEICLQNLLECGYDQTKALDTIDKKLRDLPQRFKPLARIQMKNLEKLLVDKRELSLRAFQERAMRTYHIAEVQFFRCFMENYKIGIKNRDNCSCPVVKSPELSHDGVARIAQKASRIHQLQPSVFFVKPTVT